ncbi:MAG: hypothetical protein ACXAB5_02060, partial [Candidatus Thorarchaeota archaeon]
MIHEFCIYNPREIEREYNPFHSALSGKIDTFITVASCPTAIPCEVLAMSEKLRSPIVTVLGHID